MSESWKWKVIGTLVAIVGCIYILVPSVFDFRSQINESEEKGTDLPAIVKFFPKKAINLGLDLRGGIYLEMSVDLNEALSNRINILMSEVERFAENKDIKNLELKRTNNPKLIKVALDASYRQSFKDFIQKEFREVFEVTHGVDPESANHQDEMMLKLKSDYAHYLQKQTLKQALEAVRNRIDRYGVLEASIQIQGDDRLIVEIPGVKNPDRVIDVIRKTGILEFKIVDHSLDHDQLGMLIREVREKNKIAEGYSKKTVEEINQALVGKIPEETEVVFKIDRDPITKKAIGGTPYLLKKRADVTGDMLENAQVSVQNNEPFVSLSFNKSGAKSFGKVTKENVGQNLAIVLDGGLMSDPVIQEPILNGQARITLGFGGYQSLVQEAEDLALVLREGALPASLTIATKTIIGPSLGHDSIRKGLVSLLLAALLVVVFMIGWYKLGGLVSTLALTLNVLFIFGILSMFQASLTLPGMAGIVLTLGMAVDANIIIFERMKEEMLLGKTAQAVVDSGYGNAMSAIMDANITTLIAGIVLYQFGTGPIKGFATTLMIGIATTLFTGVVVTRLIYDYYVTKKKIKKLYI